MILNPSNPKYKSFALTDKDAETRFLDWENQDPFPEVPSALLNSADIYDYARTTAMIWPFETDPVALQRKLKPASYEIDFCGQFDINGPKGRISREITADAVVEIPKNSIAFITLKPKFRLPSYMAIRFNLRINLVHRGLLLGTGPLVDPGFAGQLLIPLHNLTSEDFVGLGSDGFIWVEFTKLSPHRRWGGSARQTKQYSHFPESKRYRSTLQYFASASPSGIPAQSSIPNEVEDARKDAKSANNRAEAAENSAAAAKTAALDAREESRRLMNRLAVGGLIATIITLGSVIIALYDLNNGVQALVQDAQKNVVESNKELAATRESIAKLTQTQGRQAELAKAQEAVMLERIRALEAQLAKRKPGNVTTKP